MRETWRETISENPLTQMQQNSGDGLKKEKVARKTKKKKKKKTCQDSQKTGWKKEHDGENLGNTAGEG